jgi:hypothetical protein
MARETLSGVKKKYQKELEEIKKSIWLKCADCQGYFVDGYFTCLDKKCPLRGSYPPERTIMSPSFKKLMSGLAKDKKNDQEFLEKILPPVKVKKVKKVVPKKKTVVKKKIKMAPKSSKKK